MNIRKIIAMLAAVLMLFSVLPMGAMVSAAAIKSFDFENGEVSGWESGCSLAVVDDNGNKALKWDASGADWANTYNYGSGIAANTDYVITLKVKADRDTDMNLKVLKGDWSGDTFANTFSVTTEWQDVTIEVNTGDGNLLMFSSNTEAVNGATYYLDDIVIAESGSAEPDVPSAPAEVGKVTNGDFENGDEGWKLNGSASIENGALKIDNCSQWAEAAMAEIAVEVGTEYTLSWKSQRVSGNGAFLMFLLKGDSSNHPITGQNWMNSTSSAWVEHSLKFTAEEANLKLKLSAEVNSPGVILIDDIKLFTTPKAEVGKITNGDFETGDISGWNKWQSTEVNTAAAHTGSYGAHIKGNGGWGGMLDQTFAVEDGKTYELSFWYKVNRNGFNMQFNGVQTGASYASTWTQTNTWTQFTKTFTVAGDTQIKINFCGGGNGIAEDAYIDDVMIRELKEPSDDGFIKNGDFETGSAAPWNIYSTSSVCAEAAYAGDYGLKMISDGGWGGTGDQNFTVEIGKKYVVNMWIKTISNGVNIQIQNPMGTNVASAWVNNAAEWTKKSFEFTATDSIAKINFCGGGNNIATTVYVDSIEVVELKDPSFDGVIYNGDFEAGSLTNWDVFQQTVLSKDAAKNGTYGANLKGEGGWGAMLEQTSEALVGGQNYAISFWAKVNSVGSNWSVKQNGADIISANGTDKVSGWLSSAEWTQIYVEFEAPADGPVVLNFCGGGTGTAEDLYLDDVVFAPVAPACQHQYDYVCSEICSLCGEVRVPEKEHRYSADCDATCDVCEAQRTTAAAHEYYYGCDAYCKNCGEKTNPRARHNLIHVEAKTATCAEPGNIEYWYCEHCNICWDNAQGSGFQLNMKMIQISVDHTLPEGLPLCADAVCSVCEQLIEGWAHEPVDGIYCKAGECLYCGEIVDAVSDHETNALPLCGDGNCQYCGIEMPGKCVSDAAYACLDGICIHCEEPVPGTGHEYFSDCEGICLICNEETREAAHNIVHMEAATPTCTALGNIEYWFCDVCGMAWLDEACTMNTNRFAVRLPMAEHTYFFPCDAYCMECGELTNESASHTLTHVAAADATCTQDGNIEYWTCEHCNGCWDNANAEGIPLNSRMVIISATGHVYDDEADLDCNVCGYIREILTPIAVLGNMGTSVSEDVNGLAFGFSVKVVDVMVEGNEFLAGSVIPFDNEEIYNLSGMGAVLSNEADAVLERDYANGGTIVDVPALLLSDTNTEDGEIEFAVRVINIPNAGKKVTISARPYFVYSTIEGEEIVVYGDVIASSYNEALAN